ncbi:hypothetical protein J2S74_001381 [Evansella vedderi]|uniref:Uncharacterized protein n=1 Tax=Evansella vedderi TaxID=38282 RepID=A0ABT9ZS05_9BACI|nr:hypothetical protein [Evansella vedderi]
MQLCPECKSDTVQRTSSTPLRVILCLILIFIIPFGLFFAWIPFVFPHTFECKNCGKQGNESELKQVDWREREMLLVNEKAFGNRLQPIMEYWFEQMGYLYKITMENHMFVLVKVSEQEVVAYHIHDLKDSNFLVQSLSGKLAVFTDTEFDWEPTSFGEKLFTSDEIQFIQNRDYSGLKDHLHKNTQLVQPFNVYEK